MLALLLDELGDQASSAGEVEIILLGALGVVALVARQAEQPFLEDGIVTVLERQGETEVLLLAADAG